MRGFSAIGVIYCTFSNAQVIAVDHSIYPGASVGARDISQQVHGRVAHVSRSSGSLGLMDRLGVPPPSFDAVKSGRVAHQAVAHQSNTADSEFARVAHVRPAPGPLDGAIIPAKSGRAAHTPNGDEIGEGGVVAKKQLSLFGRLMAAINLGPEAVPTAQPTPPQPDYLRSDRLYVKATQPSFLEKALNKIIPASKVANDAPQAYMDGVSKPNWSLDH